MRRLNERDRSQSKPQRQSLATKEHNSDGDATRSDLRRFAAGRREDCRV